MRAAIGTQTIFKAVLIFTLIFVAFITVAITYNKAYKLKNETMNIIEKYEGIDSKGQTISIVNNYLRNNGYNTKGKCDVNNTNNKEYGIADLNSTNFENSDKDYYYCISTETKDNKVYYNIKIFSKFDVPFLGDIFTFKITGRTKGVKYYNQSQIKLIG